MEFISEMVIEQVIDRLEQKKYFEKLSNGILENQQGLVSFIESESHSILTREEKDLLWYCVLVIYGSVKDKEGALSSIPVSAIEKADETNYGVINDKMRFNDIADQYFKEYDQEDLLAFVEDTLAPDEDDFVTPVGRKVLFIGLKTIIDVLTRTS